MRSDVITDYRYSKRIKGNIMNCVQINNLDEVEKFLERYKLPKLPQEVDKLNSPIHKL